MIRIFLLTITLYCFTPSLAQTGTAKLDKKYGFKNLRLDMTRDEVRNLVPFSKIHQYRTGYDSTVKEVTEHIEFLTYTKIETVPILEVILTFYDQKLSQIDVELLGDEAQSEMLNILTKEYGKATKTTGDDFNTTKKYYWKGNRVSMRYYVVSKLNTSKNPIGFSYYGYLTIEKTNYKNIDNGL